MNPYINIRVPFIFIMHPGPVTVSPAVMSYKNTTCQLQNHRGTDYDHQKTFKYWKHSFLPFSSILLIVLYHKSAYTYLLRSTNGLRMFFVNILSFTPLLDHIKANRSKDHVHQRSNNKTGIDIHIRVSFIVILFRSGF